MLTDEVAKGPFVIKFGDSILEIVDAGTPITVGDIIVEARDTGTGTIQLGFATGHEKHPKFREGRTP